MNVLLWIVQSLLAVGFVAVGAMKLTRSRAQLASTFGWVEQVSDPSVKAIGLLEVLAGVGLVLPGAVNIAPVLVAWAALGGLALAVGGSVVHLRRAETQLAAANLVFIVPLILIAWGRFGPYHF